MPITYTYDGKHAAILVTASGAVGVMDFLDHLAALVKDPHISADHITLLDARGVTEMNLSEEDLREIAAYTARHPDKIIARKFAIVAKGERDSLLGRRYEEFARAYKENTIVFYSLDVARKWLHLPRGG